MCGNWELYVVGAFFLAALSYSSQDRVVKSSIMRFASES